MKEKIFEPGKDNSVSPSPGLAAVNTHNPDEEPVPEEERVKAEKRETGVQENGSKRESTE
jgi:hypothetical protein